MASKEKYGPHLPWYRYEPMFGPTGEKVLWAQITGMLTGMVIGHGVVPALGLIIPSRRLASIVATAAVIFLVGIAPAIHFRIRRILSKFIIYAVGTVAFTTAQSAATAPPYASLIAYTIVCGAFAIYVFWRLMVTVDESWRDEIFRVRLKPVVVFALAEAAYFGLVLHYIPILDGRLYHLPTAIFTVAFFAVSMNVANTVKPKRPRPSRHRKPAPEDEPNIVGV